MPNVACIRRNWRGCWRRYGLATVLHEPRKAADTNVELKEMTSWNRRNRQKRDLHFLNKEGMVACNPRDREAAHRAEFEGIATDDPRAVTCKKCWAVMRKTERLRRSSGSL